MGYVSGVAGSEGVFDVGLLGVREVLQGVGDAADLLFLSAGLCHEPQSRWGDGSD